MNIIHESRLDVKYNLVVYLYYLDEIVKFS